MTTFFGGSSSFAAPADDLAAIRDAITNLRQDYEAKIKDLEDRLQKAQAEAEAAKASAESAQAAAQDAQKNVAAAQPAPEPLPHLEQRLQSGHRGGVERLLVAASTIPRPLIPGFALGDSASGPERGFSLGESEVNLTANIDPYFLGWLNLSFGNDNSVSVEEAYIQTTSLGEGLTLRAGRMFSGIAYLNERHAHDWSFSDASLPYRAFLNNQYGDDGVQARWLAADVFLELGAEWFRGDSLLPAGCRSWDGHGDGLRPCRRRHQRFQFLVGGIILSARPQRPTRDTGGDLFSGTDDIGIASLVYKWAPGGNPIVQESDSLG
jgi:hypothetical protein